MGGGEDYLIVTLVAEEWRTVAFQRGRLRDAEPYRCRRQHARGRAECQDVCRNLLHDGEILTPGRGPGNKKCPVTRFAVFSFRRRGIRLESEKSWPDFS